ncbi:MAG TPA: hypothetical protein VLX89_02495 [Actinomycetota bacterium]|nr:hypothetical protein [Actinomycetota bacterium]
MPTDVRDRDLNARRGLWLSIAGVLLLPVTMSAIALIPQGGWRSAVYVFGLAGVAAVSLTGGTMARRALAAGTPLRVRAGVGAAVGLWVGITAAILCFLAFVGTVL